MPTYVWNKDTNTVSGALTDQTTAQYQGARGGSDIRLIIAEGNDITDITEVQLDTAAPSGFVVGLILRDPSNLDTSGYLAGPTILTRGATADDGYIGTTSTDTSTVRALMGVGQPGVNQTPITASAVFYYVPVSGGDPVESQPFTWVITPQYLQTGTPPASIVAQWASPEQLSAAIALAAAAITKPGTLPLFAGEFLFGDPDGSTAWGTFPSGLSPSFGNVTATGTLSVGGAGTFASSIQAASVSATGAISAASLSGDGSAVTNLNPAALSGPVPLGKLPAAVAGGFHYAGAWDANANNPSLASGQGATGAVYRVSVAGSTLLDGINTWLVGDELAFDGTQWDKFDGTGNEVLTVDGVAPVAGAVTLLADQPANVASKRTLGTGSQQAAAGNDTRFPAYVYGLRKGGGNGSADTLAQPGTDYLKPNGDGSGLLNLAPFHPISTTAAGGGPAGGPSGNGTTITLPTNVSYVVTSLAISDNSGTFKLTFGANFNVGDLIATINFATAFTNAPRVFAFQGGDATATGSSNTQTRYTHAFGVVSSGSTIKIYAGASSNTGSTPTNTSLAAIVSGENVVINYEVFVN